MLLGKPWRCAVEQPSEILPDCYEIVAELGRGTTGVVYAVREKRLNRRFAVKVPGPWTDPARFMWECRVLAGLTSEPGCNIPTLHAVTGHRGGWHAVRELVDGDTLEQRVRDGSVDFRAGLRVILSVAGVVEWVHSRGLVHRNLSPANVLVGDNGGTWLIGFGRVRRLAADASLPVGAAGVPAAEDVRGLQGLLERLVAVRGRAIPAGLERVTVPGAIATVHAFREAVSRCLA